MRLLVGLGDYGHFYAYHIDTLEQLKDAYIELAEEKRPLHEDMPSFSKDSIKHLPQEIRNAATLLWNNFDFFEKRIALYNSELQKIKDAKTEAEFWELVGDLEGTIDFYLIGRNSAEIVEVP